MNLRIVVADDNPKWLLMLVSILEAKCQVVATAVDGKSALQAIFEFKPDVAVLDLAMPAPNGIDITRQTIDEQRAKTAGGDLLRGNCRRNC